MFGKFYPFKKNNSKKQALELINLLVVKEEFIGRLGLKLLIIPIQKSIQLWLCTYHFFGMFFAQRCLMCNVKNWHRALLTICELGCATREELLRTVQ